MAKLSDVFLHLVGADAQGKSNYQKLMEMKQQQSESQRLTALAHAGSVYDISPTQETPSLSTAGMDGVVSAPAPVSQGIPVPGMSGYSMTPRTEFDQVPEYLPNPNTGKMEFTGNYKQLARPRGGKTTAYKPPSSANADRPRQTPYTDENGVPLLLGGDGALTPATIPGGGKAVPFKGDESSIGDANLIAQQSPNVDKLFDAYAAMKVPGQARAQATGVGGLIDPATKQLEDSLKLTAFTFGGKNLTGQEKEVVFGALFPNWKDNDKSREQKRNLLKDFFAGKVDLLQAANLLGSAGGKLRQMLEEKGVKKTKTSGTNDSSSPLLGNRIRVRSKLTGKTGTISSVNMDESKYEAL